MKTMEPLWYRSQHFIAVDHPDFEGHFPGHPVFPAVSQIDLVMQSLSASLRRDVQIKQVKRAKFLTMIHPGTHLDLEIKVINGSIARWLLRDTRQVCSQGEFNFVTKP